MYIILLYRICFSIFKPVFIRQRIHRVVSRRAARVARAARRRKEERSMVYMTYDLSVACASLACAQGVL